MGVSIDTFAAAGHFCEHLGLQFPLLGDFPRNAVGRLYGVFNEERNIHQRTTFVIDRGGIVRARIDARDPAEHPAGALAALRSLE